MTVYFIYANVPREVYDKTLKFLLSRQHDFRSKGNMMRGLYAITNKKKLVKEFFEFRDNKEIYTLVEKEMDKSDWQMISKDRYHDLVLKKSCFIDEDSGEYVDLVVTHNEAISSQFDGEAYLSEFGPCQYATIDYMIFSKSVIAALDTLGYTTFFDISTRSIDPDRKNAAEYNLQFHQTSLGRKMINFSANQANTLLYLYREMFVGVPRKEDDE